MGPGQRSAVLFLGLILHFAARIEVFTDVCFEKKCISFAEKRQQDIRNFISSLIYNLCKTFVKRKVSFWLNCKKHAFHVSALFK